MCLSHGAGCEKPDSGHTRCVTPLMRTRHPQLVTPVQLRPPTGVGCWLEGAAREDSGALAFSSCLWETQARCGSVQPPIIFGIPWTAVCQASLSLTVSRSLPKFLSIASVMPSSHLIPCHPLLLPPSTFPSIRVFSNELALSVTWPKYRSFRFSVSPSNEYSGLISFRMDCPGDSQESSPASQSKAINWLTLCLLYGPALTTRHDH